MVHIESRPSRQGLWITSFIDIEGHCEDSDVAQALDILKGNVNMLNILGSYPKAVSTIFLTFRMSINRSQTDSMNNADKIYNLAVPGVQQLIPYKPGKPIEELERELLTHIIKLASMKPLGPGKKRWKPYRQACHNWLCIRWQRL
jgi:hypothetical protein